MKLIVNKKRPVNLDLGTMKFPPMAIASVLHRISGVIIFVLLPLMIWFLSQSVQSEEAFNQLKMKLAEPLYKIVLWAFCAALVYHIFAGIRHMIMDLGFGEDLCTGRISSVLVIVLAVFSTIFLGIWIW
jgi:succinate dehydrogenase / fumarate reductase, cytochrome b subunit